jgi:hypothetical protein
MTTQPSVSEVVQDARGQPLEQIDTPFCDEVRRTHSHEKFPYMPEDDIAIVVSYVLQQSV